jgi:hypothetical protein
MPKARPAPADLFLTGCDAAGHLARDQGGHSRTWPARAALSQQNRFIDGTASPPEGKPARGAGREPGGRHNPRRGSRSSGGPGRAGGGSVSSQVTYGAPCPVVIILPPSAAVRQACGAPRGSHQPGLRGDSGLSSYSGRGMEPALGPGEMVLDGEGEL